MLGSSMMRTTLFNKYNIHACMLYRYYHKYMNDGFVVNCFQYFTHNNHTCTHRIQFYPLNMKRKETNWFSWDERLLHFAYNQRDTIYEKIILYDVILLNLWNTFIPTVTIDVATTIPLSTMRDASYLFKHDLKLIICFWSVESVSWLWMEK